MNTNTDKIEILKDKIAGLEYRCESLILWYPPIDIQLGYDILVSDFRNVLLPWIYENDLKHIFDELAKKNFYTNAFLKSQEYQG
jgi:hypothetical protein